MLNCSSPTCPKASLPHFVQVLTQLSCHDIETFSKYPISFFKESLLRSILYPLTLLYFSHTIHHYLHIYIYFHMSHTTRISAYEDRNVI